MARTYATATAGRLAQQVGAFMLPLPEFLTVTPPNPECGKGYGARVEPTTSLDLVLVDLRERLRTSIVAVDCLLKDLAAGATLDAATLDEFEQLEMTMLAEMGFASVKELLTTARAEIAAQSNEAPVLTSKWDILAASWHDYTWQHFAAILNEFVLGVPTVKVLERWRGLDSNRFVPHLEIESAAALRAWRSASKADGNRVPAQTAGGAIAGFRPTPQQERIINILRDSEERMTTTQILEQLDAPGQSASIGVVKQLLAELVRNNVLDNRQDVVPKGYGIKS